MVLSLFFIISFFLKLVTSILVFKVLWVVVESSWHSCLAAPGKPVRLALPRVTSHGTLPCTCGCLYWVAGAGKAAGLSARPVSIHREIPQISL